MNSSPFENYQLNNFFDEMFGFSSEMPLPHYQKVHDRFPNLLHTKSGKNEGSRIPLLEHGVTFTVYGDEDGTEKIFRLI